MNSPAQALLWQLWRRHRWFLIAEAVYLFGAALLVPVLPIILRRTSLGEVALRDAGAHLVIPCVWIFIHYIAMFTILGNGVKDAPFSSRTFVLPIQTRKLVLWPMLYGSVTMAGLWLFVACLVLRPTGSAAPLAWPAMLLVMFLTVMQALSWTPLAQSWLRILFAVAVFVALFAGVGSLVWLQAPEPVLTSVFGAIALLAGMAATRAVAMARRGDTFDWRQWDRIATRLSNWRTPAQQPFASAARAQLWFECRQFALQLPLFTGAMLLVIMGAPVILGGEINKPALLASALSMPLIMAGLVGGSMGKRGFSTFLAARPARSAEFLRSKFVMAAISALATWALVLTILPLLLLRNEFYEWAAGAINGIGIWNAIFIGVAAVLFLVAATWLNIVSNLWLGLTGRPKLNHAVGGVTFTLFVAAALFGLWTYIQPSLRPYMWTIAQWLACAWLAAKLAAALWVLHRTRRLQLLPPRAAMVMLGAWSVAAAGMFALGYWLVPSELMSMGAVAVAAVLMVPFTRMAGAVLALEWNRHR